MRRKQPELRSQVATLALRSGREGSEACLVTSRETRRWLLPKGWPIRGVSLRRSAAIEAREEAGLVGRVARRALGSYRYWKRLGRGRGWELVEVLVYRMDVERCLPEWQERKEREVCWLPVKEAAGLVGDHELFEFLTSLSERNCDR